MTFFSSDADIPEFVATELNRLLADWAATHRLSDAEIASVRANVLTVASTDTAVELDAEWLWSLLRPLTALLEDAHNLATSGFNGRARRRWPLTADEDEDGDSSRVFVPYLQLA